MYPTIPKVQKFDSSDRCSCSSLIVLWLVLDISRYCGILAWLHVAGQATDVRCGLARQSCANEWNKWNLSNLERPLISPPSCTGVFVALTRHPIAACPTFIYFPIRPDRFPSTSIDRSFSRSRHNPPQYVTRGPRSRPARAFPTEAEADLASATWAS